MDRATRFVVVRLLLVVISTRSSIEDVVLVVGIGLVDQHLLMLGHMVRFATAACAVVMMVMAVG